MKTFKALLVCLLIISLCSCSVQKGDISKSDTLLDTLVTIKLYNSNDQKTLNNCFKLIKKYEKIFSATLKSAELYQLNANQTTKPITISQDLATLIQVGIKTNHLNPGFDITIRPVSSLWDFKSNNPSLPNQNELVDALKHVGSDKIVLRGHTLIKKDPFVQIDLGALAKGYIADKLKDYLLSKQVNSAIIDLGGNILCVGDKAGDSFKIAVQKPFSTNTLKTLNIKDKSVVTSGSYERYFKLDGKLYHHILNPQTGYPYSSDIVSITIISNKSQDGDALSTLGFIMGRQKAIKYLNSLKNTDAIIVDNKGHIYYTRHASHYLN